MGTDDNKIPACVCTAHPPGEDRRKWMIVAECTSEFVTFCCKRCSEITHTAVVQVRTIGRGREKARYEIEQQRRQMDPRLRAMLERRKRGGVSIKEEQPQ